MAIEQKIAAVLWGTKGEGKDSREGDGDLSLASYLHSLPRGANGYVRMACMRKSDLVLEYVLILLLLYYFTNNSNAAWLLVVAR